MRAWRCVRVCVCVGLPFNCILGSCPPPQPGVIYQYFVDLSSVVDVDLYWLLQPRPCPMEPTVTRYSRAPSQTVPANRDTSTWRTAPRWPSLLPAPSKHGSCTRRRKPALPWQSCGPSRGLTRPSLWWAGTWCTQSPNVWPLSTCWTLKGSMFKRETWLAGTIHSE